MLATLASAPLTDPMLVYEPKYDGIRAIAEIAAHGDSVRLWSRLGNEKTMQFPEIADALARWAGGRQEPVVLDGEIVALDAAGRPAGFQNLQGRIHVLAMVKGRRVQASARERRAAVGQRAAGPAPAERPAQVPVAFIAFDVLRYGEHDLRGLPLTERRKTLERLLGTPRTPTLRLSEQVRGDGRAMQARAAAEGWEGLIAKRSDSPYRSGKRSPDWRKLKIVHEQEFVVGGWTDPRQSRSHFGALLLGVYGDRRQTSRSRPLLYAGHVGTGFDERELSRVMTSLKTLATGTCPFAVVPATNEPAHWVKPRLVAQVRFAEWTADGVLRHPVYLGLRDDKAASRVHREEPARSLATHPRPGSVPASTSSVSAPRANVRASSPRHRTPRAAVRSDENVTALNIAGIVDQLDAIEKSRKDAVLDLPGDRHLKVTNLHKLYWPQLGLTKGDLFRYYARVAPFILPVIADRPLVMKRYPDGVAAKPFYQHRVEEAPAGVRIEPVSDDARPQIVGGDLLTLLYTTQLAAISQDPWFSRVASPDAADFVALDLDPAPGTEFGRVLSVARWVHDELERLGAPCAVKTSGADGVHIYVPLPLGTTYDVGILFAQIVATLVADRHPKEATVERSIRARGSRVYVDFMQNGLGKTLASAYSARASEYAGVSTPLTWEEVERGVAREDFTIATVPARLRKVGDLWKPLRESKGVDLSAITRATGAPAKKKQKKTRV